MNPSVSIFQGSHFILPVNNIFRRNLAQHALAEIRQDFLLNDARGRWFLARLASENFMYTGTFTGNSGSFFNEGRRSVVLKLYDDIRGVGKGYIDRLFLAEKERFDISYEIAEWERGDNGRDDF